MRTAIAFAVGMVALTANAQPLPPPAVGAPYTATTVGAVNLTGTTAETNLVALKIPANTLGKNGAFEIVPLLTYTNSANNKTLQVRITNTAGSTSGGALLPVVLTTTQSAQMLWIIRSNNATNAQTSYAPGTPGTPFGTLAAALGANPAVDTTQDVFVNINGQLALGTETLTLQHAYVVVYPHQ